MILKYDDIIDYYLKLVRKSNVHFFTTFFKTHKTLNKTHKMYQYLSHVVLIKDYAIHTLTETTYYV